MSRSVLRREQVLTLLAQTPPRTAVLPADLEPEHLHATPPDGEWSACEVLAHLHACADVRGDCSATMVTHDTPTLRAVTLTT